MNTETCQPSTQVSLSLTKWELANLHLPPVTTVTLYSGTAPVQFLRHRIALILKKNPWLTSRIVKKSTTDGLITSVWHNGIVFCPRAGEIGMLIITRRFDSDALTEAKRESGSRVPMGARLI